MVQAAEALPTQPAQAGTLINLALEQAQLYTGLSPEDFGRILASIRHHAHEHGICEIHLDFAELGGHVLRSVTIIIEHDHEAPMDKLSLRSAEADLEQRLRVHGISGFYYVLGTIHSIPDISSYEDPETQSGPRYVLIAGLIVVAVVVIWGIILLLGGSPG
jgi:hypothetical protein